MTANKKAPLNRVLAALSKKELRELLPKLESVPLVYNQHIYEPGEIIRHVYFPESGIISLLAQVDDDSSIEVGILGDEGIAGLPVFLGIKYSTNVAVVQGAGTAYRLTASDFLAACESGTKLRSELLLFMHSLMFQISQSAACNRFHPIEERLARWLLMTGDRMHADEFQITQEFLSNMLGVRREAVNRAAGNLERRGLIRHSRGQVTVREPKGLEEAACPCYQIIRQEYERGIA